MAHPVQHPPTPENLSDPFRGGLPIPGIRPAVLVYPHSKGQIDQQYMSRKEQIVGMFQQNMTARSVARWINDIEFTLHMCGHSVEEAVPSILVFCPQDARRGLEKVLFSKELGPQYLRRRSNFLLSLPFGGSRLETQPLFNLYFWASSQRRTVYTSKYPVQLRHSHQLHHGQQLQACGLALKVSGMQTRFATIGCAIQVGNDVMGISTRHLFPKASPRLELPVYGSEEGSTKDPSDDCFSGDEDYCISHIRYYDPLPSDTDHITKTVKDPDNLGGSSNDGASDDDHFSTRGLVDITWEEAVFLADEELESFGFHDLDWSLVKLGSQHHPNMWRNEYALETRQGSESPSPIAGLSRMAVTYPAIPKAVAIITRGRLYKYGIMYPGVATLGSIAGRIPATAWTMMPAAGSSAYIVPYQPGQVLWLTQQVWFRVILDLLSSIQCPTRSTVMSLGPTQLERSISVLTSRS